MSYVPSADQTAITVQAGAQPTTSHVVLTFASDGYRVSDWGQVARQGDTFVVDARVEQWTGATSQVVTSLAHDYDLGTLATGSYSFTFKAWGQTVETQPFSVGDAQIDGTLWNDADGDAQHDAAEPALAGWTVYLDLNDNAQLDVGENATTTDANGAYRFTGLAPGTYVVRQVLQQGWEQTAPDSGAYTVTLTAGQTWTASWESGTSMTTCRSDLGAAVDAQGNVYAIGGCDTWWSWDYALASVERFDGSTWSAVASMHTARDVLGAATDQAGRIYCIGGINGYSNVLASVERYDAATGRWTYVSSLDTARYAMAATTGADGRIYAIGGSDAWDRALSTVEVYDPSRPDLGWQDLGHTLNVARDRAAAVTGADGRIYVLGGAQSTSYSELDSVECFDPSNPGAGWTFASSMPTQRQALCAVTTQRGTILAIGGYNGSYRSDVYEYDPGADTWSAYESLGSGLACAAAVVGPSGTVSVLGGDTGGWYPIRQVLTTSQSLDFGNRMTGPTIDSLGASPAVVAAPASVTLTADGVIAPYGTTVQSVAFYRETNGIAGLQTDGRGADALVGIDAGSAGGWTCDVSTVGLGKGTFTFYAQATDSNGARSATGTSARSATVTVTNAVYIIGNHADAQARGWSWVDVDQDVVIPVFSGRSGYAVLTFDQDDVLQQISLHGTDARTSLALYVRPSRTSGGDGLVQVGQVTSDGQASLSRLDLSKAQWVGPGIDMDGTVRTLRLGDLGDNVDLTFQGQATDRLTVTAGAIGHGVDLSFGGTLTSLLATSWAGGTIDVADVGCITVRAGDFGADLYIDPATNPNGGFRLIRVTGGDYTGSINVPGSGGMITVRSDRHGNGGSVTSDDPFTLGGALAGITAYGGHINLSLTTGGAVGRIAAFAPRDGNGGTISGAFNLGGGARLIQSRGGDIDLTSLTVGAGGVSLWASEARLPDRSYQGGSVRVANPVDVVGRTTVYARGGSIDLAAFTGSDDIRLLAVASRTQADTGHITAGLTLTGGRRHQIDSHGGDVTLSTLDVAHGDVRVWAREMWAEGGDITITGANVADGKLDVRSWGGTVTVTGSVAGDTRLWTLASRTQANTGHITADLTLTGGRRHYFSAYGGDVTLSKLDVAHGDVRVWAREIRGLGGGDVTISAIDVADGKLDVRSWGGTVTVTGSVAGDTRLWTLASRTQANTGHITADLTLTGGRRHYFSAYGGDVTLSKLDVAHGDVRVWAREIRGLGGGDVTISAIDVADGKLDVRTWGGNVTVTGSVASDTNLWALASRTQANTGHITADLALTGGRRHQARSYGGNVHFTRLNVGAGGLSVWATEARVIGAYQGGGIRIDGNATIQGNLAMDARGGDIAADGLVRVLGDVTRLAARAGREGTGGRLIAAADNGLVDIDIRGALRSLIVDQLQMDVQVNSLARAMLRADSIGDDPRPDGHGSLLVRDSSGSMRGVNQTIRTSDTVDGLVHAFAV